MKKRFFSLFLLLSLVLTSGFGCKAPDKAVTAGLQPINLTYWRAWDDSSVFDDQIKKYTELHPNVKVAYRKFRYEEYERELIQAFAEDRGPDIFSIPNTWVNKYQTMIEPLPEKTSLVFQFMQGSIKKELVSQIRVNNTIKPSEVKSQFVDVVYNDVVIKIPQPEKKTVVEKIYGLPLFVDTLALFYNKDLFNNAGIAQPPVYWDRTFQQYVKKLTKQDAKGQLIQSGVALGGSKNIQRSFDILSILMMQNGAVMQSDSGQIQFAQIPNTGVRYNPGIEALRFYTDFANPSKEVYSWNKELDDSVNLFVNNQLAMMFGYSYQLPIIKAGAPKLNFAVTKLPQIENSGQAVNFANYWVETVSKKIMTNPDNLKKGGDYAKLKRDSAWDFVQFITKEEQAKVYIEKTKRPTALRSLVEQQSQVPDLGVFVSQVLTSKSWYHGKGAVEAEGIFNDMIDQAVLSQDRIEDVISQSSAKVQQTVN
ncbi:extracellular solute-binding protein [Candidatus Falkowbacteria bacterium]|nr:extracellular solute-binding protein [Candidatus Falkowbacteria bacterium]